MMIDCPGYQYVVEVGEMSPAYSIRHSDCEELKRRKGHRPGGGLGYPESWNKMCPKCKNEAVVTRTSEEIIAEFEEILKAMKDANFFVDEYKKVQSLIDAALEKQRNET